VKIELKLVFIIFYKS